MPDQSDFPRRRLMVGAILLAVVTCWVVAGAQTSSDQWTAPARAARKKNPVPADDKSLATGKQLYTQECLSCHGATGKGDGPAAKDLDKSPGNLSNPQMWQETDGALFWKITEGRKPMPSFAQKFTDEQRWNIVNYVRTLAPKPAGAGGTSQPAQ